VVSLHRKLWFSFSVGILLDFPINQFILFIWIWLGSSFGWFILSVRVWFLFSSLSGFGWVPLSVVDGFFSWLIHFLSVGILLGSVCFILSIEILLGWVMLGLFHSLYWDLVGFDLFHSLSVWIWLGSPFILFPVGFGWVDLSADSFSFCWVPLSVDSFSFCWLPLSANSLSVLGFDSVSLSVGSLLGSCFVDSFSLLGFSFCWVLASLIHSRCWVSLLDNIAVNVPLAIIDWRGFSLLMIS